MGEKNISYENRIVAFIDILGFREIIKSTERNEELFKVVYEALNDIRYLSANLNDVTREKEFGRQEALFSDNIVISYLTESPEAEFSLIFDAMFLQLCLLYQGVLVRGGITVGRLYHSSNLIFGPALVRAYELESKYAIYPRILVDDKYASGSGTVYSIDFDGLTFLNVIENYNFCNYLFKKLYDVDDYDYFSKIQEVVKSKIKECHNTGVKAKLLWLENYFNQTFKIQSKKVEFLNSSSTFNRVKKL